ncbi:UNVERIFIED_CONTAM: hypothetical protein Slati_4462700 [Sesamum latifolium]|uniref:DUF4283 domain-containing protein n=1 Tax=Sesamum latifolium TaxID=2727402 RepID=A0AAW2SS54_9LAMI
MYVPPTLQNGEIIVHPSIELVREGSRHDRGVFSRPKAVLPPIECVCSISLLAVKEVIGTQNGFYFFRFKSEVAMEEVIAGGPWLLYGQPIVLQRWESGMTLRKHKHTQVPSWIKLQNLPVEFWTDEGLSTVASGVGHPLYSAAITKVCMRLDFARVCVMLEISSKLLKHMVIIVPKEDGGEVPCRVNVEYEWVPP